MAQPPFDWQYGSELPDPQGSPDGSWRSRALAGKLSAGAWLGRRFRVLSLLGKGGMGVVYRAHDASAGRDVALKVVARQLNARQLERFRREGELTARLNHPGIVGIHEAGELEGIPFLSYELIEGGRSLEDAFADRAGEVGQRVEWVAQAAEALGHAHERGIIHRDVKPANVLIDPNGQARVADFGLALGQDVTRMTQSGAMLGTPTYMPPEQISGQRDLVPAADVWSLGVMLYEALCRELPFGGDSLMELAGNICEGNPRPPRDIAPQVDRALEAVCLQCMSVDPARRYPDAVTLAADLRRAQQGEPIAASSMRQRWVYHLTRSRRWQMGLTVTAIVALAAAVGLSVSLRDPSAWRRQELREAARAVQAGADPAALRSLLERVEAEQGAVPWLGAGHLVLASSRELDVDARLRHARRALDLDGGAVVNEVVDLLLDQGRYTEAAEALSRHGGDTSLQGLLRLGDLELLAGRLDEAAALAKRLKEAHPEDSLAVRLRVRVHLVRGELAQAEALLDAIPEAEGDVAKRLLKVRLAAASGQDALALLRDTAKDTSDAARDDRQQQRAQVLAAYVLVGEVQEAGTWCQAWDLPRRPEPGYVAVRDLVALLLGQVNDATPLTSASAQLRRASTAWLLAEGRRNAWFFLHPRPHPHAQNFKPSPVDPQVWLAEARRTLGLVIVGAPSGAEALSAHLLLADLAIAQREDGVVHLRAGAVIDPSDPRLRARLAEAALAENAPERAFALLPDPPAEPRGFLARGRALLSLGRPAEAVAPLRAAFEPLCLDDVSGEHLAEALRRSGSADEADAVALRVARLRGSERVRAAELYERARNDMKQETARGRLEVLEQAIELHPRFAEARFLAAKLRGKSGSSLVDPFRELVHATADEPYLHGREATSVLRSMTASGLTLAMGGQSATNLGAVLEALCADPRPGDDLVRGFLCGALVEFEHGDLEHELAGLGELDAVLAEHPESVLGRLTRGFLHLRRGHLPQAQRDLAIACEITPESAWFYLGLLRAKQGAPAAEVLDAFLTGQAHGHPGMTLDELAIYPEIQGYLSSPSFREALLDRGWQ